MERIGGKQEAEVRHVRSADGSPERPADFDDHTPAVPLTNAAQPLGLHT
jgi:hypothetical protein